MSLERQLVMMPEGPCAASVRPQGRSSAPAVGQPYLQLPSSLPSSSHISDSPFLSICHAVDMNRSWHFQMQIHRNYLRLSNTVYSADQSIQHPSTNTTTMDPTTLVTFLFKAPAEARTVELLGSWDNFTNPYLMEHDRRRGTGYWSGCFKFENIIFDGDSSNWNKPRTGGLKQGGTYWYYYRLNDEVEAFDDAKSHTTTCPLLPGQPVNVIDVPLEVQDVLPRGRSASMDVAAAIASLPSTHTMNPKDKFTPLDPPPPSKVHGRCLSDYAVNGRLENRPHSVKSIDSIASPSISSGSGADRPISPTYRPANRYYNSTYDYFPEGRNSLHSQRSWHSSASSFAHSSIYDEYHRNSFELTPVPELPSSRDGLDSSASYDEDNAFDFGFYSNSNSSYVEDVEPWVLESNLKPPSCSPSPVPKGYASTSRPTTSRGRIARPASKSASINDHHIIKHTEDAYDLQDDSWPEDSEEQRPNDGFDILSPSFSAATISSVGINTPFRLSLQASGTTSAYDANHNNESSLQQVAERLRSLSEESLNHRSRVYESEERALSTYTLPRADEAAARSVTSLGKLSLSDRTHVDDLPPLPALVQQTTSGSFAEDVFGELDFLSGPIVTN